MPLASNNDTKTSFFDESLDAFVLEDELNNNATLAQNDQAISWVAESDQSTKAFRPIYFDFDQHRIRIDQEPLVNADVDEAKRAADRGDKVVVEGHSCHSAGSKSYNILLSEHRAQEVAHRLINQGVSPDQIKVIGRGTEMAVVIGGDRDQQAPNRRVELFALQS